MDIVKLFFLNMALHKLLLLQIVCLLAIYLISSLFLKFFHKRSSSHFSAISGENVISVQLNLAKAYLELNKNNLAKPLLKEVIKQGTLNEQTEAKQLLASLTKALIV